MDDLVVDSLEKQSDILKKVLTEYDQINKRNPLRTESVVVFDDNHYHYLLVLMGWEGDERIKSVMIHARLKDGKIWIEEDWTEDGIATDLVQNEVAKSEIVLAFQPPQVRQHTEFAAA